MMKNITLFLFISIFIFSCKSELEKIDINDFDGNINYQNKLLDKDTSLEVKFDNVKKLISEYRSVSDEKSELNENYCTLLARLYERVNYFPVENFWVDIKVNKIRDTEYFNFYDSAFYFSEKALSINKNNIRAMYYLSSTLFFEKIRFDKFKKYNIPFSFNKNQDKWSTRINYILNNALRFKDLDTSISKKYSQAITECALFLLDLDLGKDNYAYVSNDENLIKKYYLYGQLFDQLKGKKSEMYNFEEKYVIDKVYPNVLLARNEFQQREIREQKMANIRQYGSQYIGRWQSDAMKSNLTIYNNGSYEIYYYGLDGANGKGTWDCTSSSIFFTKTSGEHVAFMFEEVYHSNTATFEYNNIFAPTLCLNGPDGHVDFCFSHHNQ